MPNLQGFDTAFADVQNAPHCCDAYTSFKNKIVNSNNTNEVDIPIQHDPASIHVLSDSWHENLPIATSSAS